MQRKLSSNNQPLIKQLGIKYCKGIIDPKDLTDQLGDKLDRILNCEAGGMKPHKLKGHNVYSIYLNESDRLLYTYVTIDNEQYMLLLDIVLKHKYEQSFALKPELIHHFIEVHGQVLKDFIKDDDFEPITPQQALPHTIDTTSADECELYNGRFIQLNQDQREAANAKLPLILFGGAGSGKSCTAISKLVDLAQVCLNDPAHPDVIYVTQSQALCESMEKNWLALALSEQLPQGKIKFLSYQALANVEEQVGIQEFESYFSAKISEAVRHGTLANPRLPNDVRLIYQEMRIISGYSKEEREVYLQSGEDQSLIDKKHTQEREWLFDIYFKYVDTLKISGKIDLGLCDPEFKSQDAVLIIDEAQDFSHLQLKLLLNLANKKCVYCLCEEQSLSDALRKKYYLHYILNAKATKPNTITLKSSYRCPATVIDFAHEFLLFGARLTGQAKPVNLDTTVMRLPGAVRVLSKLNEAERATISNLVANTDFVVITLAKYFEEARERFKCRMVVTVDQFKGQEADYVLYYRPLDENIYFDACKELLQDKVYAPAFYQLYTGCTRARKAVIFLQDNPNTAHRLKPLMAVLEKHHSVEQMEQPQLETEAQRNKRLFTRAINLLDSRKPANIVLAHEIMTKDLGKTEVEFNDLLQIRGMAAKQKKENTAPTLNKDVTYKSKNKKKKKGIKNLSSVTETANMLSLNTNNDGLASQDKANTNEKHLNYVRSVLKNPTEKNLINLFIYAKKGGAKAKECLFSLPIPEHNDECLFTLLFDIPEARKIVMSKLVSSFDSFGGAVTPTALCRKNNNSSKPSPLFWLCTEHSGIVILKFWFDVDRNLALSCIQSGAITRSYLTGEFYNHVGLDFQVCGYAPLASQPTLSAWTFLALDHQDGHYFLFYLLNFEGTRLSKDILSIVQAGYDTLDCKTKKKTHVFAPLCKSDSGIQIVSFIVARNHDLSDCTEIVKVIANDFIETEYRPAIRIFDQLCNHKMGINVAFSVLTTICESQNYALFETDILNYLFMPILKKNFNVDLESVNRLMRVLSDKNCTSALITFLQNHPDYIFIFDINFLRDIIKASVSDESKQMLMKQAQDNDHVWKFYEYIYCRLEFNQMGQMAPLQKNQTNRLPLIDADEKLRNYVRGVLHNPVEENLKRLFNFAKAAYCLYDINLPEYGNECLFTLLFDNPASRELLLTKFLPSLEFNPGDIPHTALCRNKINSDKHSPLFWMCTKESGILVLKSWLTKDINLCLRCLKAGGFTQLYRTADFYKEAGDDYQLHGYAPLQNIPMLTACNFLAMDHIHGHTLLLVLMHFTHSKKIIPSLFVPHLGFDILIVKNKQPYSLVAPLCETEGGRAILKMVITYHPELCRCPEILSVIAEDQDDQHYNNIFLNLTSHKQGKTLITEFFMNNSQLSNSPLSKTNIPDLLLMAYLPDGDKKPNAILRIIDFLEHPEFLYSLHRFLIKHPQYLGKFDKSFFSNIDDWKVSDAADDPRQKLINHAIKNAAVMHFYKWIKLNIMPNQMGFFNNSDEAGNAEELISISNRNRI